jgi:aspartyl-tRNA(Asn)/glutamyl-tRNA(Gln) amidotransferase subunit C
VSDTQVDIDIAHVAKLARLALTQDEAAQFAAQFAHLFTHIRQLQELDLDAIGATAQVIPLTNVMREDVVTPSLDREAVLGNAPDREGPYFKTPRILE